MSDGIPTLIMEPPTAGWWPISVEWQGQRYDDWASCTPYASQVSSSTNGIWI
jgi:hypothetical protein